MDFTYDEHHQAVADLAEQIIAEHADPARLTALESEGWFDRELWRALADAGLLGIALAEDVGGAGLDTLALHPINQQVGATAAHVPFAETTVAALALDRHAAADVRAELLPGVAAGTTVLTIALVDDEPADLTAPAARVEGTDDGLRLRGVKTLVPAAVIADRLLVTATTDDDRAVVVVVDPHGDGVALQAQVTPSDVPHARVTFSDAPVQAVLGDGALVTLLDHGRTAVASAQAGLAMAAVRLSAEHTAQREQFGRAIATFQAVSQRVADARIAAGMLDLVALQAAWRLAEGLPASQELTIASWWVGEAGHAVIHAAHHVHGGIGVDRDYPLHRLFGRAKQHEFAMGSSAEHLVALGQSLAAQPA